MLGLVGTSNTIEGAKEWIERCKEYIPSQSASRLLFPDFPGFEATFHATINISDSCIQILDETGDKFIKALKTSPAERFNRVLDLYEEKIKLLANSEIKPDLLICCLTDEIVRSCWSISRKLTKNEKEKIEKIKAETNLEDKSLFDEVVEETEEDLLNRDFRRALKARAMKYRMPIQIGTSRLFLDSPKGQLAATRAWNFCVALYYKSGGIPWRWKTNGPETCFVGISFHHLRTTKRDLVHSSIAQAFSTKGEGFAIKGESVPWNRSQGKNVHLSSKQAFKLGKDIIDKYQQHTGGNPLRIVLHKTSRFNIEEEEGFKLAFKEIAVVELINLMNTSFRLVKFDAYPPNRGTLCEVNDSKYYLFTTGFVPELKTYPGPHIPTPAQIVCNDKIDIKRAAEEVLGLTRMNWNTASVTGGQPVTFFFARNVGGIISEYTGDEIPTSFRYYM